MDNLTPITREEMLMNDETLTPITREEKILAGEDLNPVTRREYFLKKYRHAGGDVMVEGLSVTENGTYTAPEGKAYSPVEVAVPMPENAYLLKTASGSLVSFSDGTDLPMPSCICNIDAVQDLHGYDAPWVGGAGKNLLETTATSQTINGVTYTVNDDGTVTVNGTATDLSLLKIGTVSLIGGTSYVLSSSSTNNGGFYLQAIGTGISKVNTINGAITFTPPTDMTVLIRIAVAINNTVNNVVVKPMLCLASAQNPTVFVPYENICPISGHTGLDAWVRGKNLWPFGDITHLISGEAFYLKAGTYTIKADVSNVGTTTVGIRFFYADDTSVLASLFNSTGYKTTITFTDDIVKINAVASNGTATNVQIELGETDSTFEPYNPQSQTIQVSWQTEAGEVFGGYVDLVSGELTVTDGYIASYNGETLPSTWISDRDTYAEGTSPTTGAEVVYKLANPQTYQLDGNQIKSLLGNNNAWCSTGDIDIDYFTKEVTG